MSKLSPFCYFKTSPEIIRLAVMMYVRFPLSLRNVEDLLHERGIEISHETVRFWWNRFGPMFAAEIRRKRVDRMRAGPQWRWYVDEVFVKINGERHYAKPYVASCTFVAIDHEVPAEPLFKIVENWFGFEQPQSNAPFRWRPR
jgi:transposase-like protein